MARYKHQSGGGGNKSTPKTLKRRLSTKRNLLEAEKISKTPPLVCKSITKQNYSEPQHLARKCIVISDQSIEQSSSDSDSDLTFHPNGDIFIRKTLSGNIKKDSSTEKSTLELGKSPSIPSTNGKNTMTVTSVKNGKSPRVAANKVRKSGNHLRPFTASNIGHRRKSGVLALQQIRYYQRKTGLLIPKTNFQRLVKEMLEEYSNPESPYRIQSKALLALQEAAETRITQIFEAGQLYAIHANRVTLMNRDFKLAQYFNN